jgi:hypothetical protein
MISIVGLFLVGMVALAIMGRLRRPGGKPGARGKCPACGRHRIGKGPCPCGKAG